VSLLISESWESCFSWSYSSVADLHVGKALGVPPPFLGVKKEEMTKGRKAHRASKTNPQDQPLPMTLIYGTQNCMFPPKKIIGGFF